MRKTLNARSSRLLEAGGVICLLVLALVVFIDVVARSVANHPLPWGTELLEVVLAAMIFLLYPVLALRSEHITVDLIRVGTRMQRVQRVVAALVGLAVFGIVAWSIARQAIRSAGYGEALPMLGMPLWWVLGGMAVFSGITALAFIWTLWHDGGDDAARPFLSGEAP